MTKNATERAAYHLSVQTREIAAMTARTELFERTVADTDITVLPEVYPGGSDSVLTIDALGDVTDKSVLDLCTGTGIVAIKAALAGAQSVTAVDLNPAAVANTKLNAERYNLEQVLVLEGSLFEPVGDQTFDIIAINPPYTAKKPANKTEICFWDEDNQTTRAFFEQYQRHINPGGIAYLAWADFASVELIEELARANNTRLELIGSQPTPSGLAQFLVYRLTQMEIHEGQVSDGVGNMSKRMAEGSVALKLYEDETKQKLIAGSLNVTLDHEVDMPPSSKTIVREDHEGRSEILIAPALINGIVCHVVRNSLAEAGKGRHAKNVVELISEHRLREKLSLNNGDPVTVIF